MTHETLHLFYMRSQFSPKNANGLAARQSWLTNDVLHGDCGVPSFVHLWIYLRGHVTLLKRRTEKRNNTMHIHRIRLHTKIHWVSWRQIADSQQPSLTTCCRSRFGSAMLHTHELFRYIKLRCLLSERTKNFDLVCGPYPRKVLFQLCKK